MLRFLSLLSLLIVWEKSFADCSSLDEKLQHQYDKYQEARILLIKEVVQNNSFVDRNRWEKILTPDQNCALSESEENKLQQRHQKIIQQARQKAIKGSLIDISLFNSNPQKVRQFCQELPKGGQLHIHPNGTLNSQTLKKLGAQNLDRFFMTGADQDLPQNFSDFARLFGPMKGLLGIGLTPKLKTAIMDYLKRAKKHNVIYVELTKTIHPSTSEDQLLEEWSKDFRNATGIIVRWNVGFMRHYSEVFNRSKMSSILAEEWQHGRGQNGFKHIRGIDLYSDESTNSALEKAQGVYAILAARRSGQFPGQSISFLKRTMHAGEHGDHRNVRDAMIMGVDRVGHGVKLHQDLLALEYARRIQLPIEINLVSNYRLKSVNHYSDHPFLNYLRLGLPVSLSTDDEGMFKTDTSTECEKAIKYFDIQYSELKQMSYNSIQTSFAQQTVKTQLLKRLNQMFAKFESKWSQKKPIKKTIPPLVPPTKIAPPPPSQRPIKSVKIQPPKPQLKTKQIQDGKLFINKSLIPNDKANQVMIKASFDQPKLHKDARGFSYTFPEIDLEENETIYLAVPQSLWDKDIIRVKIGHRKDQQRDESCSAVHMFATNPSYTSADRWRWFWPSDEGYPLGGKPAPYNKTPLKHYAWPAYKLSKRWGHYGIKTSTRSQTYLQAKALRVMSLCRDNVKISGIEARFY